MSLTLASCSDLFEPADENNRGLNEIYNEPTYAQGLLGYGYAMLPYNTKSVTDIIIIFSLSASINLIRSASPLGVVSGSFQATGQSAGVTATLYVSHAAAKADSICSYYSTA